MVYATKGNIQLAHHGGKFINFLSNISFVSNDTVLFIITITFLYTHKWSGG